MKRKSFSPEFKANGTASTICNDSSVNELASEFAVHTSEINDWKRQLLAGASETFSRGKKKREQANEEEKDRLYCQVGKLQVELDWLKKKTGHLGWVWQRSDR